MYSPHTLSKMAAQSRREIHRNQARKRLAKDCLQHAKLSHPAPFQKVLSIVQKFAGRIQWSTPHTHENVESKV